MTQKTKCDLDECYPNPCSRCARLGSECMPHLPNKKSKKASKDEFDDDSFADSNVFAHGLAPQPMVGAAHVVAHFGSVSPFVAQPAIPIVGAGLSAHGAPPRKRDRRRKRC